MKHRALKICIENFQPNNPEPYQEYLIILPYMTEDLHKTFWEIEMLNKKQVYHFKEYVNCYWMQNVYYDCDRFLITRIEFTQVDYD